MGVVGEEFAQALGRKDAGALRDLLDPAVDFKALTPGRFWEASDAASVVDDIMLGTWFKPTDAIDEVVAVDTATVAGRERVGYRFRVVNPDGQFLVEQQAYYESDGGRIQWLRVLCAGYQAIADDPA
jgi:hypothetical protein